MNKNTLGNYPSVLRTIKGTYKGERVTVRIFKDAESAAAFICKGDNWRLWREYGAGDEKAGLPLKAGKYAWAGGRFHNVKSLDPSALAHI